jgi:hypothetical protein
MTEKEKLRKQVQEDIKYWFGPSSDDARDLCKRAETASEEDLRRTANRLKSRRLTAGYYS